MIVTLLSKLLSGSPEKLTRTAQPFHRLSRWYLVVPLLPIGLTLLLVTTSYVITFGEGVGLPLFPTLVYGVANIIVLIGFYFVVDAEVWRASRLSRQPSRNEIIAGGSAALLGVVVGWPLTNILSEIAGVTPYTVPSVSSFIGAGSLFFGAVIVAPIAEEILFRGLLFGHLINRGTSPAGAGTISLIIFSFMHIFVGGVAGVLNALLLGALLTWLRLRYDNLIGAWLMHFVNNALEFAVALAWLPSLYQI